MHNPDFLSDTPRPAAAQLIIIITIIIMSVVEDDTVRDPNEERCRLVFPATRAPKSHCRTAVGRFLTAHAPHSQTALPAEICNGFLCAARVQQRTVRFLIGRPRCAPACSTMMQTCSTSWSARRTVLLYPVYIYPVCHIPYDSLSSV